MRSWAVLSALYISLLVPETLAVKHHDFKTCSQAGFCRRGRALGARAKEAGTNWNSPYSIDRYSVNVLSDKATVTAAVKSSLYPEVNFGLELRIHEDGVVRVKMDEVGGLRKRYDEAASWALISEPRISKQISWYPGKDALVAKYGPKKEVEVIVTYAPFTVTLLRDGKAQVVLNGQGLLHMEHFRQKVVAIEGNADSQVETAKDMPAGDDSQVVLQEINSRAWFEGEEDAWWEETFSSWTDSKPKGPESLSVDINFPNHGTVYGIPQHATRLALPTTTGDNATFTDPYRLYNADVFEYIASSTMSLYGSIPLMHAHSVDSTVAIFNAIGSETWIDVSHPSEESTQTHWISESGIMDIFLLPGPTPEDVFRQYARLTGTSVLPAHWSLGYHQCRWNYVSSDDIRSVQKRFEEEDMPVDVFWLDIEYSEDHMYFMWDKKKFPDPIEMINDVDALGRHMVVIVDPHLKRASNYPVYQEASQLQLLVKSKSGEGEYEGWCWSGSSSWIDFFNPASWDWWKTLYKPSALPNGKWSWTLSTENVHIWNDMNEPSVFNGPEITMPKDNVHYGGWEHRDIHNINGMLYSNLTSQAVATRSDIPKRPFILTRAFFAGSQRFGAMWTGDNMGTWEHMAVGIKMALSNGIAGMTFGGSDVGGFFGNPEPEMLVRWYQVGAFAPFFRAHAHLDTKRREPFLLEEPYKGIVRDILRLRYSMLPIWYTQFREASVTGIPILRPQYVIFPKDKAGFDIDDQYYIGTSLLIKPITEKGVTETSVYIAENQVYYDYFTGRIHRGARNGRHVTVQAELDQIPLFIRGGSILPTRDRPRRASTLMKRDPFTLRVALDNVWKDGIRARGELYLDDGETYGHQQGEFVWREFTANVKAKTLRIESSDLGSARPGQAVESIDALGKPVPGSANALAKFNPENNFAKSIPEVRVEKVVVVGLGSKPKSVKVEGRNEELVWEWEQGVAATGGREGDASVLRIKEPKVLVTKNWALVVQL